LAEVQDCVDQSEDPLDSEVIKSLRTAVADTLHEAFSEETLEDFVNLRSLDGDELDDLIVTESRRLKRDERLAESHKEAWTDERDRLQSFKRARETQEREERHEAAKLHPHAKAVLDMDMEQLHKLPIKTVATLTQKKRQLEDATEPDSSYDPDQDAFLRQLASKIMPVVDRLTKKRKKSAKEG